MDTYSFDFTIHDGDILPQEIIETDGSTSVTGVFSANAGLIVGVSPTEYSFPAAIGTNGYVLAANTTSGELEWVSNAGGGGGSGDIINGGQTGPVSVGTTDATDFSLISGGKINIGSSSSGDQILIHGSVAYQYDSITSGVGTFTLTANHYFVEINTTGITQVDLPDVTLSVGRAYIISKGTATGSIIIDAFGGQTIDNIGSLTLSVQNQRIRVISNGVDKWYIV